MIVDLQVSSDLPELRGDVIVAGAGPAGMSLALELAAARPDWHIILLEAGGVEEPTDREKAIYSLELGDKSYSVAGLCRRRKLGGTTAHWGGWAKPPDETDFLDNPGWTLPAWPFGPEELAPHLEAACRWCALSLSLSLSSTYIQTHAREQNTQGRLTLTTVLLPQREHKSPGTEGITSNTTSSKHSDTTQLTRHMT